LVGLKNIKYFGFLKLGFVVLIDYNYCVWHAIVGTFVSKRIVEVCINFFLNASYKIMLVKMIFLILKQGNNEKFLVNHKSNKYLIKIWHARRFH